MAGKITVKAHSALLGLRAGQTGEIEDNAAAQAALASGRLEKVTAAAPAGKRRAEPPAEPPTPPAG